MDRPHTLLSLPVVLRVSKLCSLYHPHRCENDFPWPGLCRGVHSSRPHDRASGSANIARRRGPDGTSDLRGSSQREKTDKDLSQVCRLATNTTDQFQGAILLIAVWKNKLFFLPGRSCTNQVNCHRHGMESGNTTQANVKRKLPYVFVFFYPHSTLIPGEEFVLIRRVRQML